MGPFQLRLGLGGLVTDFNKHNPYPFLAAIRCPRCDAEAEFRKAFALVCKNGWEWWHPRLWPSARATDWEATERWGPGDPAPTRRGWIVIEQDPELYRWKKPPQGYERSDEGIVRCSGCVGRRRHVLDWPRDAYYRFELPQGVLWAWGRECALALVDFIASTERDPTQHGPSHYLYLRHIPKAFLGAADRESIAKRLRRQLRRG